MEEAIRAAIAAAASREQRSARAALEWRDCVCLLCVGETGSFLLGLKEKREKRQSSDSVWKALEDGSSRILSQYSTVCTLSYVCLPSCLLSVFLSGGPTPWNANAAVVVPSLLSSLTSSTDTVAKCSSNNNNRKIYPVSRAENCLRSSVSASLSSLLCLLLLLWFVTERDGLTRSLCVFVSRTTRECSPVVTVRFQCFQFSLYIYILGDLLKAQKDFLIRIIVIIFIFNWISPSTKSFQPATIKL